MVALTALLWSLTIPLDKLAVERATAPFHGVVLTAGVAVAVLVVLVAQRAGAARGIGRVRAVLGSASSPWWSARPPSPSSSWRCLMYVGTVETLKRGIGNFMALLSGRIFFREAVTARKVLAVVLMAVGVGMILT